jgi:hypothetical protein
VEEDCSPVPGYPEIRRRISIGGRLLIYVAEPADAGSAAQGLGAWVTAGRTERDRRGMNRLRLVVVLNVVTPETVATIEAAFSRLPELAPTVAGAEDAHIHLHCLSRDALAPI